MYCARSGPRRLNDQSGARGSELRETDLKDRAAAPQQRSVDPSRNAAPRQVRPGTSGQLAMRKLFEEHLKRVEWDEWKFPLRLYSFLSRSSTQHALMTQQHLP